MKKVFFNNLKIVGLFILLIGMGLSYSWADSLTVKQKQILQKRITRITTRPIVGANLVPSLWVNCGCNCQTANTLSQRGYIFADKIIVYVYNNGDSKSSLAHGKVEFYDLIKQRKIIHNFTVMPTNPKYAARVKRAVINGPFLIRKTQGIKVSVTFRRGIRPISITNSSYERDCSILY